MYKYLSLLSPHTVVACTLTWCSLLTSCTSTYTKVNLSPMDADKAQCHYEAERDLAYARGIAGLFREIELEKACMQAKGYTQ
jgi:hypothetical protein